MNDDGLPRKQLIRLFTEAGDATRATELEAQLLAKLASFNAQPEAPPEAYWKEPGWFEHFYALSPANADTFDAVIALVEAQWHISRDEECDAVWNPAPGHTFLLPEVRWAELMLITPNPPAPDQEYLSL